MTIKSELLEEHDKRYGSKGGTRHIFLAGAKAGLEKATGSYEGGERIDGYVELEIATQKKCDKCHSILETTYKVPQTRRGE